MHPPPTELYTLSLHDALPISRSSPRWTRQLSPRSWPRPTRTATGPPPWSACTATATPGRSEEHTSELQSRLHLVCRLLLEKKKKHIKKKTSQATQLR